MRCEICQQSFNVGRSGTSPITFNYGDLHMHDLGVEVLKRTVGRPAMLRLQESSASGDASLVCLAVKCQAYACIQNLSVAGMLTYPDLIGESGRVGNAQVCRRSCTEERNRLRASRQGTCSSRALTALGAARSNLARCVSSRDCSVLLLYQPVTVGLDVTFSPITRLAKTQVRKEDCEFAATLQDLVAIGHCICKSAISVQVDSPYFRNPAFLLDLRFGNLRWGPPA